MKNDFLVHWLSGCKVTMTMEERGLFVPETQLYTMTKPDWYGMSSRPKYKTKTFENRNACFFKFISVESPTKSYGAIDGFLYSLEVKYYWLWINAFEMGTWSIINAYVISTWYRKLLNCMGRKSIASRNESKQNLSWHIFDIVER